MSRLSGFLTRVRRAVRLGDFNQQMNEEMRHHIEEEMARRIVAGDDPATAGAMGSLLSDAVGGLGGGAILTGVVGAIMGAMNKR